MQRLLHIKVVILNTFQELGKATTAVELGEITAA